MKKVVLIVLLAITSVFTTIQLVAANEGEVADVTVHVKKWDGEYDLANTGAHHWGPEGYKWTSGATKDDFGLVLKFTDVSTADGELGVIAVGGAYTNGVFAPDWNKKITADIKINTSELKAGVENHVYVFQGDLSKGVTPHFVANPDEANMLLVYADPSGVYEENLGIHNWNDWNVPNASWGDPSKVFVNGAYHGAVPEIKVAMLSSLNINAGLLIYAGDDNNKKTGDVTLKGALGLEEGEALVPGSVGFAYVYSKGNGYSANDNVTYGDSAEFVQNAFSFKLLPMGVDKTGQFTGTYAPRPGQVIVELSAAVPSPLYKEVDEKQVKVTTEAEIADANAKVLSWFTVNEIDGAALEIESVDFSQSDETLNKFVLILKDDKAINVTKNYEVEFDLGLENEEENKAAKVEVAIDRGAPVIGFINPADFDLKPAGERIIIVEWNKKFDRNLFPRFTATDDRDGDITKLVYVVSGEGYNSLLDTNRLGDYEITLRVEDAWGNVTTESFIFRVQKKGK